MSLPGRVRTERELRALTQRENEARLRAAAAVHEKREHPELSLAAAAKRRSTTPANVKRHFGHLMSQDAPRGRYRVAPSDREPFLMNVVGVRGQLVEKVVRGSTARQRNLAHHRAMEQFAGPDGGGDLETLEPFQGKQVAGVELLTDPDAIERMYDAAELDFLEYQSF